MFRFTRLAVLGGVLVCLGLESNAMAQEPWESIVVADSIRDAPAYHNSSRLALDRRGRPNVIYVQRRGTEEALYHAGKLGDQWRSQLVYSMTHDGKAYSGINAYALAMDRRDRPHVYLYAANYAGESPVFEERWAFRDRRWEMRLIRHNSEGGAVVPDPNLAIDMQGYLNVTAYIHNAYDTEHRVHLRYFDGSRFGIEAFPRPPGKTDSDKADLVIDNRNTIHFVYGPRKALRRGDAEPGYPDTSLAYITRTNGKWSAPVIIRPRLGPDPNDTGYYLKSAAINLDRQGDVHVTYAINKRGKSEPTYVMYAHRARGDWQHEQVATVPAGDRYFTVSVSKPYIDGQGNPHLAFDTLVGTTYTYRQGDKWLTTEFEGDLQGFAMDARTGVHLLCSYGPTLTHHRLPNQ
jgi:hypothetical protein